jgi:menaquinol-cytochrome c reductase iron-sulfur subunit
MTAGTRPGPPGGGPESGPQDARHGTGDRRWSRRGALSLVSAAAVACGAAIVAIPFVGFVFAPLFEAQPQVWRPVGPVGRFRIGTTVEVSFPDSSPLPWAGIVARTAAWLRRESAETFVAFSVDCTHLGCPVRWLPQASLFMCPCHGGVYYADGTVAAGPPPRPLPQYPVRVRNGQVEIRTTPIPITTI